MKKIIWLTYAIIIVSSIFSNEAKYNFISDLEFAYSKIPVNINGDKIIDFIIPVANRKSFYAYSDTKYWAPYIKDFYFVISNNDNSYSFYKLDNKRFYSLSVKEYTKLKDNLSDGQLGEVKDFFFIKDFNKNGIDEIYMIEYVNEKQYFIGYEFDGLEYKVIIDVDINGRYKHNFINIDSDELNFVRGFNYKKIYQKLSPNIYRSWRSYYRFDPKQGIFICTRTEEIETPTEDFF